MANEDVNSSVNYWNANYSGYGTMSKNFLSMRTILNNNSAYSAYDLQGMYNAIYAFTPPVVKCFSRTSAVLMSDLSWKWIHELETGDMIFTSDGPSALSHLHITKLGFRRMYEMYDGSLSFSSDHCLWVRRNEGDYFWVMDKNDLQTSCSIANSPVINNIDNAFIGSVDREEQFAHVTGWKTNKPVLTGITAPDYTLYSPVVENKGLIIVNGYLVDSDSNESTNNYNFNWDDIINNDISNSMDSLPELLSQYIKYRTENPNEIP